MIALPALVFSLRYLEPTARGRTVAVLTGLFLLALAALFCARDPLTFLAAWELMTLLPAAVILVARDADGRSRRTVFTYLSVTHLGGAGTWIAVLLLAQAGAFGGAEAIEQGSGLQIAIALAALVGMGTKAGLMPLHVWLPRAHPMAPAPVSALMSGVMIKAAIYALVRVLVDWVGVAAGVVRRAGAGARRAVGRRRRHLRALPARPQAAARAALDREHRDHRARPRRLPRAAGARRGDLGGVRARRPRCCTR